MRVTTQLKDMVSFSKGEQIKGSDLLEEGLYDYLNGGITPSGKWNRYNTPKNTVTVSEGGNSCGYVNYMDRPFWCGAHCYYLFNSKLDDKYLYYALKSQQNRLMKIRSGACMPNIKKSDLGAFKLTYETDEMEQKEIVKRLDKVKLVVDLRKTELQQLDELVKSRFVEMFENSNYPVIKLGDVCSKITDGTHKTPTYLEKGITFISAKNIVNGELNFSDIKHISEQEYAEIQNRCQTEIGDILLSKSGSLGSPVIVKTAQKLGLFESLAVIKYDRDRLLPEFLCEQLKSDRIQRQFKVGTKGVSIKHLHLGVIADTGIIVPPLEEQNEFATFVKQVDKSKFCVTNHLKKTQLIKGELL